MMRGEETELMGLFRMPCHADLAENCVTILPGTHSKHIHIRSRKIEAIETFMSGECLEVLSQHSILSANADMEVLWKQGFQWTSEEQKKPSPMGSIEVRSVDFWATCSRHAQGACCTSIHPQPTCGF